MFDYAASLLPQNPPSPNTMAWALGLAIVFAFILLTAKGGK